MMEGTAYSTFLIRRVCALLSSILPTVIVCAAQASRSSHAIIGYDQTKMAVVANGFDVSDSQQTSADRRSFRAKFGWSDADVVVGCVGRFNFYKDHANFVAAAGLLAPRFPSVRFLMVGKGLDTKNQELGHLIAATGYPDRFKLLGFRDDVPRCLGAMDVFCLSSRSEGFPNVVGEAMSVGTPCVATDVGDARILLSDTGIIVAKEDSKALCEGIAKIIEMPRKLRVALGQRGRDRVIREFSMSRARDEFEAIYRSLCGGAGARRSAEPSKVANE
jgi:glycosyltransferase involved in cell wall biosynthesis